MTLDSNIIIAYLNGDVAVIETIMNWRREGRVLFLSTVAEAEILSFSSWTEKELLYTESFLSENFASVIFDRALARITAKIRQSSKIKLPDAAIAATAISTNTPLVTRNRSDFIHIPEIQLLTI